MNISSSSTTLFSLPKETARPLVKTITDGKLTLEPERTEEEKRLESSTLSFQRELTPEEQNRVLFLKNMLAQLISLAGGTPTEEQKARIKEIEKELEKITGVKMNSSISNTVKMISGKKKEDEEEEQQRHMTGIDPKKPFTANSPHKANPPIPACNCSSVTPFSRNSTPNSRHYSPRNYSHTPIKKAG